MSITTTPRFLDRNDLARMLDVSYKCIVSNETRWGIAPFRVRLNDRVIRFHATLTLKQLEKMGFLLKKDS